MQLVNFSRYPLHVIMSVERDFPSANYYPFALTEMDSFEERSLHFSPWEDRFIVENFDVENVLHFPSFGKSRSLALHAAISKLFTLEV